MTGLVIFGGVALSFWAYRQAADAEQMRIDSEFQRRTEVRHSLTTEIINNYEAGLFGLRNVFVGSESVTRAEFAEITADILARYPGITALEWAPLIPHSQRAEFEETVSRELSRPYQIVTPDGARPPARAPDAESYVPILYVEPLAGNELTLGLELGNSRLIDRSVARREQRMIISGVANLVQGRNGLVMVWPIFRRGGEPGATQGQFMGFLQAVFRTEELFEQTQRRRPSSSIDTLYIDTNATNPALRIMHYRPGDDSSPRTADEASFESGTFFERPIQIGGRTWRVLYRPTATWKRQQATPRPLVTLGGGLAITALVGFLVHTMGRRNLAIESLVSRRTAELSESRREIDTLVRALPGMAFRHEVGPGRKLELTYVSEGSHALTGYTSEEFISQEVRLRDLIHPEDVERVRSGTWEALDAKRDFELEYRIRTKGGDEKWVLARGRGFFDVTGKLQRCKGMVVDLTTGKRAEAERIRLERKLLESQKLESLGILAGGIAHDFNNLLTTIMGNASLVRLELDPALPQQKKLRQIEVTAVRAAELCHQMLAYSGKTRFVLERIDLSALVEDSLPLIQFSVTKSATIQLDLAKGLPPVLADPTQLRQIIMNLVMNSSDALGEQTGEILLSTRTVDLTPDVIRKLAVGADLVPGRFVSARVRDTGCGMPAEMLERIFDPFFTTKFTGRGLGLAAVLGIVRSHSGGLRVESVPGQGSTFELYLPPTEGMAEELPGRPQSPPLWHHTGSALVVDDEKEVREVATEILEKIGFTVVPVKDGSEALAVFGRDPARFDFVLLDLTMPGLGGEEVFEKMRAANPRLPIVIMSGHAEMALVDRIRARATGFLGKPFTLCSLIDCVRTALQARG